jgi:hypothetical protein
VGAPCLSGFLWFISTLHPKSGGDTQVSKVVPQSRASSLSKTLRSSESSESSHTRASALALLLSKAAPLKWELGGQ